MGNLRKLVVFSPDAVIVGSGVLVSWYPNVMESHILMSWQLCYM
jgi:hypothetical protein